MCTHTRLTHMNWIWTTCAKQRMRGIWQCVHLKWSHMAYVQATAGLKEPTALNGSLYAWYLIHHWKCLYTVPILNDRHGWDMALQQVAGEKSVSSPHGENLDQYMALLWYNEINQNNQLASCLESCVYTVEYHLLGSVDSDCDSSLWPKK